MEVDEHVSVDYSGEDDDDDDNTAGDNFANTVTQENQHFNDDDANGKTELVESDKNPEDDDNTDPVKDNTNNAFGGKTAANLTSVKEVSIAKDSSNNADNNENEMVAVTNKGGPGDDDDASNSSNNKRIQPESVDGHAASEHGNVDSSNVRDNNENEIAAATNKGGPDDDDADDEASDSDDKEYPIVKTQLTVDKLLNQTMQNAFTAAVVMTPELSSFVSFVQCLANCPLYDCLMSWKGLNNHEAFQSQWLVLFYRLIKSMTAYPLYRLDASTLIRQICTQLYFESPYKSDPFAFVKPLFDAFATFEHPLVTNYFPLHDALSFDVGTAFTCLQCNHKWSDFSQKITEMSLVIQVPKGRKRIVTLDECIKKHIHIDRDKRVKACPKCNKDCSTKDLHSATRIISEVPPMFVIHLTQDTTSTNGTTRMIKLEGKTNFNILVDNDQTSGTYSLHAVSTDSDKTSLLGKRHRLSQSRHASAIVKTKQQRQASGAKLSKSPKSQECWLEYNELSCSKISASFLQSGNITMLWYAKDGYNWKEHAKGSTLSSDNEQSSDHPSSQKSKPGSHSTARVPTCPDSPVSDNFESEKTHYAEDWRIATRPQEQATIQWFTEYLPKARFDSRPRCILPSGHEAVPLTTQNITYMSTRLEKCIGALIADDNQLIENTPARLKKRKRAKITKIAKQLFPSIDEAIAVVDASTAYMQDIDSFEFKNMTQIKNNKILFSKSLKTSHNVRQVIWNNINTIFQNINGKQLTADMTGENTQAFCLCHVTSSAIFIYAAVVFDVCSTGVVESIDDVGSESAWLIKWIYTKASFRGLDFGKRLLQLVLKYQYMTTKANNIILAVDTTDIENRAKPWYVSLGFQETTWDACSDAIQKYATSNRYNENNSDMIPFQVQSDTSRAREFWEVHLEINKHTIYSSMLIYEARIVRGFGGRTPSKTKFAVPSLPSTIVMVQCLQNLLTNVVPSKWPLPDTTNAHFQDAFNGFKKAADHNHQSILYAVHLAASCHDDEMKLPHMLKNVTMYNGNQQLTDLWTLHKNTKSNSIRMVGKCRIDPILRQIARGGALRLAILQHAILETFVAQAKSPEQAKRTKKIRSLELQMLQHISWTPLWNVDKADVQDDPSSTMEQRYNIYCHHCNQFLLCHPEGTIVRTVDLQTIRALTPLVVTKHFNLDIGTFPEYTEESPDHQTRWKKPTKTDACFNDLFMDLDHYRKTVKLYGVVQSKAKFAPVPLCSIFDIRPSAECIKFGGAFLDAMRCDSFVEKSDIHIQHCNSLSYTLFVAGTDEKHQVLVHGPNNPELHQDLRKISSQTVQSPTKRSDNEKEGFRWDTEYTLLDDVSSDIMPMLHELFKQFWIRSVHRFMPTLFDIYDYSRQNTHPEVAKQQNINVDYLLALADEIYGIDESDFWWLQEDMNEHKQSWMKYKDIFYYMDEMNYDSPFGRADDYDLHVRDYNESKFKLSVQGNQNKLKAIENGSLSLQQISNFTRDEYHFHGTIEKLHIPKVDTTPSLMPTFVRPSKQNKVPKKIRIKFPNPTWFKHRPVLLDDAPTLSSKHSEAEGWDDEAEVKKILGPLYWTEKKHIATHTSIRNAENKSKKKQLPDHHNLHTVTIKGQAEAEKLEILINKRMAKIVAVVDPRKLARHLKPVFHDSIIAGPLLPFMQDEKYHDRWKRWPLFVVQSIITDTEQQQFPSVTNWRQKTTFVLHARMLKHIRLAFLEELVAKAKLVLEALPDGKKEVIRNKSFMDFQPLPPDFVGRMNESVTAYTKQFIQQVKPGSLFPVPTAYISYEKTSNKFYHVHAIDTNDVFDDDDIFAQDALKTFMFCHTDTKLKLHEGRRNTSGECARTEPPITHPSCFEIPFQFSNAEGKCVFGAFLNLFSLFNCYDIIESIRATETLDESSMSPYKMCLKVLSQPDVRKQIQYKRLYFSHDTNDVELLDDYRTTCNLPIIVTLNGSSKRAHCVCIFRDQIIDGLYKRSLPYSEANLRYTLGDDEIIYSIESGIMLKPSAKLAMQYLKKNLWDDNFVFDIKAYENISFIDRKPKKMKLN